MPKEKLTLGIIIDTALNIPPFTGVTYRLYYLSKKLASKGINLTIFCCNRNIETDKDLIKLKDNSNIKIHIIPEAVFYDVKKMFKIVADEKIDILQVEDPVSVLRYYPIAEKLEIPMCLEMHDIESELLKAFGKSKEKIKESNKISSIACQLAQKVFFMVLGDSKKAIKEFGLDKNKVSISPNPIDFSEFVKNGPNNKQNNLLFVGNMFYEPNKIAAEKILEIIRPSLIKESVPIKFTFVGLVPEDLKEKYKNEKDVVFTGVVKKLDKYLKSASIALCPVLSGSGMKVKILNYSAAGLPIITTSVGASGYEGITSLIIENKLQKYTSIIKKLLSNPKKLEKIGNSNYKLSKKIYDINIVSDNLIDNYHDIIMQGYKNKKIKIPKRIPLPMWLEESRVPKIKNKTHYTIKNGKVNKK